MKVEEKKEVDRKMNQADSVIPELTDSKVDFGYPAEMTIPYRVENQWAEVPDVRMMSSFSELVSSFAWEVFPLARQVLLLARDPCLWIHRQFP